MQVNVGLLGLGTVGRGVYKILTNHKDTIRKRTGVGINIKKILVRDTAKNRGIEISPELLTDDVGEILNDGDIDVVVELMGGIRPALEYAIEALNSGKSVVTANKDMVAEHGEALFDAAEKGKSDLLFEASVCGGIPIVRPLKRCLAANKIDELMGIINGTTNYMLTKMNDEGSDFDEVLKEAQELGYAEADPSADVDGFDAARKIAILASVAFNTRINLNDVFVEGITDISTDDIAYAKELNYTVKLLAIAKDLSEGIEIRVHPCFIPKDHPLASVNDVFNAVFVRGDAVGETMFYGRGAGEMPTASAVVSDIMETVRNIAGGVAGLNGCTCYDEKPVKHMDKSRCKYFIRMSVANRPGVLASIATVFGNHDVSLASVIQKHSEGEKAEIVMVTYRVQEYNLKEALGKIKNLPVVEEIDSLIRVEGEE
ncbi:MAG TPA: homoserine dehydrogenase [Clostridia bacterium]|nr:homoserine dehydrogenase [Clostridia bacterium]